MELGVGIASEFKSNVSLAYKKQISVVNKEIKKKITFNFLVKLLKQHRDCFKRYVARETGGEIHHPAFPEVFYYCLYHIGRIGDYEWFFEDCDGTVMVYRSQNLTPIPKVEMLGCEVPRSRIKAIVNYLGITTTPMNQAYECDDYTDIDDEEKYSQNEKILEYLEEMNINYTINKNLVRGLSYYTRTVFEIIEKDSDGTLMSIAGGGRYDYLAKQIGGKKDVPAVGFSIGVDRIIASSWYKKLSPRIIKKPKMYFIQLGAEAKLKSLNVIDILRKAHIPIAQALSKDSLGSQLAIAEKVGIPYALIFGVKEALDNSVIVRDMSNRSQETVKLTKLLEYLKEIK